MILKIIPLLLITPFLQASEIDTRRHIEVDGTAVILVAPDYATWSLAIRGEAKSLTEASTILEESSKALTTSLSTAGFPEKIIKLSGISSGRYYNKVNDQRVFMGFFAERNVIVELNDLSKRQELEQLLLQDDRIEIKNVTAKSSSHEENRKKALSSAASAAKEKATSLAEVLGAKVGVTLSINQGNSGYMTITSNRIEMPTFGANSAQLEALSYSSTVTVKFELK
ncbi:SIMPL domain-containing protein [Akkermansiaceae bacterium]|nr:SIMPL domain-containing protein [Akkermansiaceae bacterium]